MEAKTPKFRIRLNLFDGIVLVLALLVGVLMLWMAMKPESVEVPEAIPQAPLRYTIRFSRFREGGGAMVKVGEELKDTTKNCNLGTVVETKVVPSETLVLNAEEGRFVLATVPECEDILVTLETTYPEDDTQIMLEGKLQVRVGNTIYIQGKGYMASGAVVAIEREGQK